MEHQDAFSACHPAVELLYFGMVLGFGMFLMHPACLLLSLCCAGIYALTLTGRRALGFFGKFLLPMAGFAAVLNPLLSHRGVTILAYLPSGNPLTLESILYGLAAAGMLMTVAMWLYCCTQVLTTDKFVYLFGRVLPALSLLLSMTLRFLPRCKAQYRAVRDAQRGLTQTAPRNLTARVRRAARVTSITVTWALETAVETADSMKCRGYGLPGRTSFSIYRMDRRDRCVLAWLLACGGVTLWGAVSGRLAWQWLPSVQGGITPSGCPALAAYLALCLTPVILQAKEERTWKRLHSAI